MIKHCSQSRVCIVLLATNLIATAALGFLHWREYQNELPAYDPKQPANLEYQIIALQRRMNEAEGNLGELNLDHAIRTSRAE